MDQHGALATLRPGFKCYGRTLHAAHFKAAHELNPELEARYAANRLGLTRQLRFSPRSGKSLDVALSLNGIPVATVELKNPLTGQRVEDVRRQYREDRDPREPIFEFKRRTRVHFAADTAPPPPGYTTAKWDRSWRLLVPQGELVCLTVYKKGAQAVIRRLTLHA
jgi:type I restriction enzyme, R subunit